MRMSIDEFEATFQPIPHPSSTADSESYLFETYGEDLAKVVNECEQGRGAHVWTLVESDGEGLVLIPGFHYVNRVNYVLTTIPAGPEYAELEVAYEDGPDQDPDQEEGPEF